MIAFLKPQAGNNMSFAKAVTKQPLASQEFLAGLPSLRSYADIEQKQALGLLKIIETGNGLSFYTHWKGMVPTLDTQRVRTWCQQCISQMTLPVSELERHTNKNRNKRQKR